MMVHWKYFITVSKHNYDVLKITLPGKHGN